MDCRKTCFNCGRNKHVTYIEELERMRTHSRLLEEDNTRMHTDYVQLHDRLLRMRADAEKTRAQAQEQYVRELELTREKRRLEWKVWEQERELRELKAQLRQTELQKQVYRDISMNRSETAYTMDRCTSR